MKKLALLTTAIALVCVTVVLAQSGGKDCSSNPADYFDCQWNLVCDWPKPSGGWSYCYTDGTGECSSCVSGPWFQCPKQWQCGGTSYGGASCDCDCAALALNGC